MKVIYENMVTAVGTGVDEFKDVRMLLIFGEHAPKDVKDCCYSVSVNPVHGKIKAGQFVVFDDMEYRITCVGSEAPHTLKALGHCTFKFSGERKAELPGTIYLEAKPMPKMGIGTVIRIVDKEKEPDQDQANPFA